MEIRLALGKEKTKIMKLDCHIPPAGLGECIWNNQVYVLIDDSIVRGTTCGRIVTLLREAGAEEIHMRISSPPFLNPCYYGTDIDTRENLIACNHSVEDIAKIIGADTLGYLPVSQLSLLTGNCDYCSACFNGDYPTEIPTDICKNRFEQKLSEAKKER